jgi:hypothetical protein
MHKEVEEFAKKVSQNAAFRSVEALKKKDENYTEEWQAAMMYASGYTSCAVISALSKKWIIPLKKRSRNMAIAFSFSLLMFSFALLYMWSILDFETFAKFIIALTPAVIGVVFTATKSYKTWAEAKKIIAETDNINNESNC